MKYHDPLKRILSQTRPHWDREEMRSHRAGETLVEHQDSIVRGQRAFPAVRWSLRKTPTHRATSYHPDQGAKRHVLGQRQKAALPG